MPREPVSYTHLTISEVVYVLIGAVGVPVFAGFRGGISVLAGPTGGYIIGYIMAALIIGLILDKWFRSENRSTGRTYAVLALAMIAGLAACYLLGTLWFIVSTGTGVWASLTACVFPFLIGDAVKIIAAIILVKKLRPLLR